MKNKIKWMGLVLAAICLFQVSVMPVQAEEYWPEGVSNCYGGIHRDSFV